MKIIPIFANILIVISLALSLSCSAKRSFKFVKQPVPKGASLAVIVDSNNNVENAILSKFMEKGFRIKAINANDFYTMNDTFTMKDFRKIAYNESEIVFSPQDDSINSIDKSYDNIYKLSIYNYEITKADVLTELKNKLNVRYLVLLDLKNWKSVSWIRVIDLESYELIMIENYATTFSDDVDTIIEHFLSTISSNES